MAMSGDAAGDAAGDSSDGTKDYILNDDVWNEQ